MSGQADPVDASGLRVEVRDDVATLTIDRPHRANAVTVELLDRLAQQMAGLATGRCRAAVLAGAGRCFSAGFDLHRLEGTAADVAADEAIGRAADAIASAPFPVVAAVHGACYGAAVELARACDVVVAAATAAFAIPAVRLGILYRPEAIARLHRRIGGSATRFLLVGGEPIPATSAGAIGLVDIVVPGDDLFADAAALAGRMASAVPAAVAATKSLLADLDNGHERLDRFDATRLALMNAPARRTALLLARRRTTEEQR